MTYPRESGPSPLVVLVDMEPEELPPRALRLKIPAAAPGPSGMPGADDMELFALIEVLLEKDLGAGAAIVGRLTGEGARVIVAYVDQDDDEIRRVVKSLGADFDRKIEYRLEDDPEGRAHAEILPDRREWRGIMDALVFEKLADAGDTLREPRRIDHLAYFADEAGCASFSSFVARAGFGIEEPEPEPDGRLRFYFHHQVAPDPATFSDLTAELARVAEELGGVYDGWETIVVAAKPRDRGRR